MRFLRGSLVASIGLVIWLGAIASAGASDKTPSPILIGLNADMSASLALGGEALRRGAIIAIDEINKAGGVLGRPLDLLVRDHRGKSDRGVDNINALATFKDLVAVMGGIHPSAVSAELEAIQQNSLLYLEPWATSRDILNSDRTSSFVFGVAAGDEYAGAFLVDAAFERGYRHLALVVWESAWGQSNRIAMRAALEALGSAPTSAVSLGKATSSVTDQLEAARLAGADVVMLVAPPHGAAMTVRDMASLPPARRLPVIAHLGFIPNDFHQDIEDHLSAVDLTFLQTFSFLDPPFPDRAERVLSGYCTQFDVCDAPDSVVAPGATAHAYDLVHLLARAIDGAGTTERDQVRQALSTLKRHDGLVRRYEPPFTDDNRDAMGREDLWLAAYDRNGVIVPLNLP